MAIFVTLQKGEKLVEDNAIITRNLQIPRLDSNSHITMNLPIPRLDLTSHLATMEMEVILELELIPMGI